MSSRSARPHVVLALALVALIAQASGFTHYVLVRHATCPEHGELVHATEGSPATHADEAPGLRASASGADGHDHCVFSCLRRERTALGELGRAVPLPLSAEHGAGFEHDAPPPPSIALFLLAPKNSPPV